MHLKMDHLKLIVADWSTLKKAASYVRQQVFILEQGFPSDSDLDHRDADAQHIVAFDTQKNTGNNYHNGHNALGTARLISTGQLGRLAVIKQYRGQGLGQMIVKTLINYARAQNYNQMFLHAQITTIDFYKRLGFNAEGKSFFELNVEHILMRQTLTKSS